MDVIYLEDKTLIKSNILGYRYFSQYYFYGIEITYKENGKTTQFDMTSLDENKVRNWIKLLDRELK